jgi:hypothetical protein
MNHHKEEGSPHFRFDVIKTFQDSLSRQVAEAVRLELRGKVLNSKSIFNRCKWTRLVLAEGWRAGGTRSLEEEEQGAQEEPGDKRQDDIPKGSLEYPISRHFRQF